MEGGWSLGAWIEHAKVQREADLRYLEARVEMLQAEVTHAREMTALQKEMYDGHFEHLNENAKRTIEERGHFVTKEAYEPTVAAFMKYMAKHEGQQSGASNTVMLGFAIAGFLFGFGSLVAWILSMFTGP